MEGGGGGGGGGRGFGDLSEDVQDDGGRRDLRQHKVEKPNHNKRGDPPLPTII